MRTIYRLFILMLTVTFEISAFAQQRTVKFTGRDRTNQYRVQLDRVEIFNLDQLWEEVIYWPDTTLMMGTVGIEDLEYQTSVQLLCNVPNPFNGNTEFALCLPEGRDVRLELFDVTGKFVVGEDFSALPAGTHLFEATLMSPQTYLLSATVKDGRMTLKMINEGHGGVNAIRYIGMTDLDGDLTVQLKKDRATGLYPFTVGDEMQYTGYTTIDGAEMASSTVNQNQFNDEIIPLLFDVTVPVVNTIDVTSVSANSATISCQVIDECGANVISRGVCWSQLYSPTINGDHTIDGGGSGIYFSDITGLAPNTSYYVRAYATNIVGTSYGEQMSFMTDCDVVTVIVSGDSIIDYGQSTTLMASGATSYHWSTGANTANITVSPTSTTTYIVTGTNQYNCTATATKTVTVNPILPTVNTINVSDITSTTVSCGGHVVSEGGAVVTAYGVCWSTSHNPTINNTHTNDGSGSGPFSSLIMGLTPNTTYYVRAYATNSAGTAYGEEVTFTTACNTVTINIIGTTSVNYGQSVTLTAHGASSYQWNTGTSSSSITVSPTSTINYTVTGTDSYGCTATATITVTVIPIIPTVTTSVVSDITANSASCGGNVTSNGGSIVTARGVCWSTSQNPTVSGSHTTDGSGTGSFTSSLTGLTPNTTYYVRAYATNSKGTGYGEQKSFTTLTSGTAVIDEKSCPAAPTVTDHEGNVYATVQIGNQCWMRDNLRTTTSPSTGTYLIPASGTGYTFTGKQARWYNNDSTTYAPMNYGLLYNWNAAVDTFNTAYGETSVNTSSNNAVSVTFSGHRRGICPAGWHLPSDAEWTQLTDYVSSQSEYTCSGNSSYIAKALASTEGWNTSTNSCAVGNNQGSNNATGFSAVPAGYCGGSSFAYVGYGAYFWSSAQYYSNDAWYRSLYYDGADVGRSNGDKYYGFSVRCLRDETGTVVIDEKSCPAAPTVTDHEGNVYATVQIGNQCWMRDNLRTTTSPSAGTYLIPASSTGYTYTGKQARWYNNDSATYAPMNYGLLYNWNAAVDTFNTAYGETSVNTSSNNAVSVTFSGHRRGICPAGWHLPSDAEWTQLTDYVSSQSEYTCSGNSSYIAKALASTEGWNTSTNSCAVGNNQGSNNATGFSAVPTGYCNGSSFYNVGYYANFWSSTQINGDFAWYRCLYYYDANVLRGNNGKYLGFSVRCLRDETGTVVIDEKSCPAAPTVTDHEGNVYATVQIGNQCWMRDNLRTTTSPSTGTYLIPASGTGYTFTGKQARWYNNDSATYAPQNYGLLYNWNAAVDTFNTAYGETSVNSNSSNAVSVTFTGHRRGICPAGWHLPSDAEWTQLTDYVSSQSEYTCSGNSSYIAKALASTEGWNTSTNSCAVGNNQGSNNATGFSAVPAGLCYGSSFYGVGNYAYFWSSTQDIGGYAWYRRLYYYDASVYGDFYGKINGFSVRCLRDETGTVVIDEKSCPAAPTVTDHEGNVYATVQIGNQCWMRDNLRTTKYADGTEIEQGNNISTTVPYWYYPDSNPDNKNTYGLLYNWRAVMNTAFSSNTNPSGVQGICPDGWHVPSYTEWNVLTDYLSSHSEYVCGNNTTYIAKALASATYWSTGGGCLFCSVCADSLTNNASGFNALPAGVFYSSNNNPRTTNFKHDAVYWSSTEYKSQSIHNIAIISYIRNVLMTVSYGSDGKNIDYGYSVRCVLNDAGMGINELPTVTTDSVLVISNNTANCFGTVVDEGSEVVSEYGFCWNTTGNPTLSDSVAVLGSGQNHFTLNLSGLDSNTTYYVKAYATNSEGTSYGEEMSFITGAELQYGEPCLNVPTLIDIDGNVYNTVRIGNQCWMKENLRTTKYADGTVIAQGSSTSTYYAYWYYPNNNSANKSTYGLLYNWKAATRGNTSSTIPSGVQGICPDGWHMPSVAEWRQLTDYVGSQNQYICGSDSTQIAKSLASTAGWRTSTTNCAVGNQLNLNNVTGLSVLPAGYYDGRYTNFGYYALIRTCAGYDNALYSDYLRLNYNNDYAYIDWYGDRQIAMSVRCVLDEKTSPLVSTDRVTDITSNSAVCYGNIISDGGDSISVRGFCWNLTGSPTTADSVVVVGSGTSYFDFASNITNLISDTTYYIRAYATNGQGTSFGETVSFTTLASSPNGQSDPGQPCPGTPTVTDHEGNVYNTVMIGSQCWTKENMRCTTSPSTGTSLIPPTGTNSTYTGKQARWYNDDPSIYSSHNYGLLYNWNAAVDTFNTSYGETSVNTNSNNAVSVSFNGYRRGICPVGWHLPSDTEWTIMEQQQTTMDITGNSWRGDHAGKLAGGDGWIVSNSSNAPGDYSNTNRNASGFSAVPAGFHYGLSFSNIGHRTYFWTSEGSGSTAWCRVLGNETRAVSKNTQNKSYGLSVRCLRDETGTVVIDEKSCPAAPTVTDHEGNVYATVQIGNQCWMRDNLRTTTSPSTGTYLIPASGTGYTFTGKQARWYNNDSATYAPQNYGLLYNWNAAVDTFNTAYGETNTSSNNAVSVTFSGHRRGICPAGWHLPSDAEWTQLTDYVSSQSEYTCSGNSSYIAKAFASTEGWNTSTNNCVVGNDPSTNNATGFSAVPAGYCGGSSFYYAGSNAYFWSSTQGGSYGAWYRYLYYDDADVLRYGYYKDNGFSVRCLRDETGTVVIDEKSCPAAPTVTDHEGNVYATVQIGDQCWMRDNLRTTTSPSTGTYLIPASGTGYTFTGKQARWYNNDSATYAPQNYGLLYNWNAAVDTFNTAYGETSVNTSSNNAVSVTFSGHRRGICPAGWHLPSDAEWTQLTDYVSNQSEYQCGGNSNYIAKALASAEGWNTSTNSCAVGNNQGSNNATGFSAVPAGYCVGSSFFHVGDYANFWSSTQDTSSLAWGRHLYYYYALVNRYNDSKYYGRSVRCLRD